jgi:fatty-acyl-CoA synthase
MEPTDPRLTLGRFLAEVAERHAERTAVVSDAATLSYAELHDRARGLARALIGAGVVKGTRVALLLANGPEWIASVYAVGMVGGVVVPVNTFGTREERDHVLRHGDASLLLLQPSLLDHRYLDDLVAAHPEIEAGTPGRLRIPALPQLRRIVSMGPGAGPVGVESAAELQTLGEDVSEVLLAATISEVEPSDDAFIIYTSGSTAEPKGVLHSHRTATLQAWRFADFLGLAPEDRVYTTYPFFWAAGIAMSIGGCLAAGATLLVQEHFEPGAALDMIERERATAVHAWPHQQKALGEHPSAATRDLRSVTKIDFSSPLARLAGLEADGYGTGASYGLSETFTIGSALPATAPPDARRDNSGRPWPGVDLAILDPGTGAPLMAGEEGEIAVKGVSLMRGYYKVLPEHVFDANGYFRTRDAGSIDAEGRLHWSGRLDNLIKTGGANVSPIEIQHVLEGHPDVKVGVPVGVGHPTLGEVLVLCAVLVEGAEPDEQRLRAWLRERLAAYKVPRRVLFFRADDLAYTGNRKIQVDPLRDAARTRLEAEGAEIDGYRYRKHEEK